MSASPSSPVECFVVLHWPSLTMSALPSPPSLALAEIRWNQYIRAVDPTRPALTTALNGLAATAATKTKKRRVENLLYILESQISASHPPSLYDPHVPPQGRYACFLLNITADGKLTRAGNGDRAMGCQVPGGQCRIISCSGARFRYSFGKY
ncbi:hypothetical protein FB45DRAFT_899412 [Roridomyces roridus]|uniref:Uncharacterized protein n=1 Tax=Roridomyces roridus TaxID=1738132 RepID=A0AAD7FWA5_9AGAR|nr:hypothetical protein FB45DRAFT_899412 [Roridomyces roridus]